MTLDSDWTNDTPNFDKHPDQHNAIAAAVADLESGKAALSTTLLTNSAYAAATGALSLTTTLTDIPGASVTVTTVVPNTVVVVHAVFDILAASVTASEVAVGALDVDGVTQSGLMIYQMQAAGTTNYRATVGQNWRVTLATAASHTLKLRANRNASTTGTYQVQSTHTTITVLGRF